jgi:hypothetical protein
MAQGVGPEFKPQHFKKTTTKKTVIEGKNMIKVYYVHERKYHNQALSLYNLIYINKMKHITDKGGPKHLLAQFLVETLPAQRQWCIVSMCRREKNYQPRILYPAKLSLRNGEEGKHGGKMPVISALGRLRENDQEFNTSLGFTETGSRKEAREREREGGRKEEMKETF